jgi:hypothetical protein
MFKRILFLVLIILLVGLTGCSSLAKNSLNNSTPVPKFEVASDKRNDHVSGLTPEIQEALIQSYLSELKTGATREKFIKVVNSLPVQGGTEFVVRVKDGFFIFFMDSKSGKIFFTSGFTTPDTSQNPVSYSISPLKEDSPVKVFIGFFNLADARKVILTWSNGTTSLYELTNGTLMISPYDANITVMKYEIKDESGKTLYSEE